MSRDPANDPPASPSSTLHAIVYSSWRIGQTDDQVIAMILRAIRKNFQCDVTGAIWFGENRFYQVLEGERETLLQLFEKIRHDPRHRDLVLHLEKPIVRRHYSGWNANVFDGDEQAQIDLLNHQLDY